MTSNKPTRQFRVRRRPTFRARFPPHKLHAVAEEDPPTLEEQPRNLDEAPDSDGEDCEIHYYEERFDTRGERVCLRVGTKLAIEVEKRKSHRACLVLTRNYDTNRELSHTKLEIQSQYVCKALKEVIGSYLGKRFNTPTITLYDPFEPLFHYRNELQEYANKCDDLKMRSHLNLCLRYVKHTLSREISLFDQTFANESSNLEIDYENLWIVYKPGELIYKTDGKINTVSRLRSFREMHKDNISFWEVLTERINYDGTDFGHANTRTHIELYQGRVSIRDLKAFPLHFHSQKAQVRDALVRRGQLYVSLRGACHRFFDGVAKFPMGLSIGEMKVHVRNRVMVDTVAFHRGVSNARQGSFNTGSPIFRTAYEEHLQMREEDFMICNHEVYGYDLAQKLFGIFSVDNIQDVKFNSDAFDHLLLSPDKKRLISSLVMQHDNEPDTFDDYIQGKGKGLIFLLHGPPGVGKTFTAESIADYVRRPLFTFPFQYMRGRLAEGRLSELLNLASSWNAVALIDEADIFLQERDLLNFERNELVSILLRVLEYFEGIMFLTTNRVETIDNAFQSRIHLSIAYPPLSHGVRQELWRDWITRENSNSEPDWLTEALLNKLASRNLNGREIKNVMKMAHALSRSEKRRMHATDVFKGLEASEEFKTGFQKDLVQRKAGEPQVLNRPPEEPKNFLAVRTAYDYFRGAARFLALREIWWRSQQKNRPPC
ncbi:P-loop containing nucleoside triphosphate hydrolase protein [Xylaria acuta]|nr:P-loop containing nucleoside triphosphate hydrolase protein [Xylaria acuta]